MKGKIIRCVAVLSCIALVCITSIVAANKFWGLTDKQKLDRALSKIVNASSFDVLFAGRINEFNDIYGSKNSFVNAVYKANDANDEIIIDASARGFKSLIHTLTVFDSEGEIIRTVVKEYGSGETYANKIRIENLNPNLKEKIIDTSLAASQMQTGATFTVKGILDSVKIASQCYDYFLSEPAKKVKKQVTDTGLINELDNLLLLANYTDKIDKYYEYDFTTPIKSHFAGIGEAQISRAFLGDDERLIFEVTTLYSYSKNGSTGGYGNWTLLLLEQEGTIGAAAATSHRPHEVYGKWDASSLDNNTLLTSELSAFQGLSELLLMKNTPLEINATNATQSNNGIIAAACVFFDKKEQAIEQMQQFEEEL